MKINIFGNKKVAEGVVEASLARISQSESKVTRKINYSKENLPRIAYRVALSGAVILLGCGIGLSSTALLATGATLAGAGILGASVYEYKKISLIEAHVNEFCKAAKKFKKSISKDEISTKDEIFTNCERFIEIKEQVKEDIFFLDRVNKMVVIEIYIQALGFIFRP
ncbi:MAG: hypothetical protein WCT85_01835 [Parachlamydiales bacterium]|jgi:hypothetical protein